MPILFNQTIRKNLRRKLRNSLTPPEVVLWSYISNKQLMGLRFRRQYGVGRYVVDFYCPKKRLVIEIDGSYHARPEVRDYDRVRQRFIESFNVCVLRFTSYEIFDNIEGVLERIISVAGNLPHAKKP
jgi:very-short-patch-repair endonuclease